VPATRDIFRRDADGLRTAAPVVKPVLGVSYAQRPAKCDMSSVSKPAPPSSSRKCKGKGYERREEILAVAQRLFVEDGYAKTTIRRIAAELGLCSTVLYLYFPDKGAILEEICANTFAELTRECQSIRASGQDAVANLYEATAGYIRFGLEHPHEYLLTFNQPAQDAQLPKGAESDDDPGCRAYTSFRALVEDVVATRPASQAAADVLTQCLWAGMHGLIMLQLTKPGFAWANRDELIQKHVAVLCGGLLESASKKA
jgi:AcrR family transcriptional regulator